MSRAVVVLAPQGGLKMALLVVERWRAILPLVSLSAPISSQGGDAFCPDSVFLMRPTGTRLRQPRGPTQGLRQRFLGQGQKPWKLRELQDLDNTY